MTENANICLRFCFDFVKNTFFVYRFFLFLCNCVITFEPIEVQNCSAHQNDQLNLSFVKHIFVDGGKLARNGQKTAILAGGWRRLPIDDKYAALL